MINAVDDELQSFGDEALNVPCLKDLHDELLVECLDEQIKNPTSSKVFYLDEFSEAYESDMEEAKDDDDEKAELNKIHDKLYMTVLEKIDDAYGLDLDKDTVFSLPRETLRTFTEGIYEFFVVNYEENVITYFTSLIGKFQDAIADELMKAKEGKDIVSNFYRDKIKDQTSAIIIANINSAIESMKSIEVEPIEFIELFDSERFSVAIVKSAIEKGLINGDFTKNFLEPIFRNSQDDMFDGIVVSVRQNIYNNYKEKASDK